MMQKVKNVLENLKGTKGVMVNWIIPAVCGITVALVINMFFGLVRVDGDSMNNTLKDGEYLVMQKQFVKYEVGNIVVANIERFDTGEDEVIIKRIIAVAGQTIEIKEGAVLVDGKVIEESYIKEPMYTGQNMDAITVPEGSVFLMGDNRNNSMDSRIQGTIKISDLKGKIIFQ